MSDLASILRIVARHVMACADELDGGTSPEPDPPVDLDEIKAQQAERRRRLGGSEA